MSLPISKLIDLGLGPEENKNKKIKTRGQLNELPDRYKEVKHLKQISSNNHSFNPEEFDKFNVAMKQGKDNRGMQDLHMNVYSKIKNHYDFADTEGWIDPAQRRRLTDPNSAPPFDYTFGSNHQRFTIDKDELIAHNNVDLIRKAHESYYNHVNRYNAKAKDKGYIKLDDPN